MLEKPRPTSSGRVPIFGDVGRAVAVEAELAVEADVEAGVELDPDEVGFPFVLEVATELALVFLAGALSLTPSFSFRFRSLAFFDPAAAPDSVFAPAEVGAAAGAGFGDETDSLMLVGGRGRDALFAFAVAFAFTLMLLLGPCLFVLVRAFAGEGSLSFSSPSGFAAALVCRACVGGWHESRISEGHASTNVRKRTRAFGREHCRIIGEQELIIDEGGRVKRTSQHESQVNREMKGTEWAGDVFWAK